MATWSILGKILRYCLKEHSDLLVMPDSRRVTRGQNGNKPPVHLPPLNWLFGETSQHIFLSPFQCLLKQGIGSVNILKILIYIPIISQICICRENQTRAFKEGRKHTENRLHFLPQSLLSPVISNVKVEFACWDE